jgi:VanZ family protein
MMKDVSRLTVWVTPIAWMAVMFWLSSDSRSSEHTGVVLLPVLSWLLPWATPVDLDLLHTLVRKVGHLAEYGFLAALWLRALHDGTRLRTRSAALVAFAIAAAWATSDEVHQAFVPGRTASAVDVLVDCTGAFAGLLVVMGRGWGDLIERTATVVLWGAAIGGVGVLGVDWLTGADSRAVWVTTPLALVLLVVRRAVFGGEREPPPA